MELGVKLKKNSQSEKCAVPSKSRDTESVKRLSVLESHKCFEGCRQNVGDTEIYSSFETTQIREKYTKSEVSPCSRKGHRPDLAYCVEILRSLLETA